MTFNSALSAGQLVSLRGDSSTASFHRSTVYISLNDNANVYTARINQSTFTDQLIELTYDGGSGTLADVRKDMTILISATNDKTTAYFRGRIRKTPTATVFYINEASGLQFSDDDYIFIIDDYDAHVRYARWGGEVLIDWEESFDGVPPLIYDVRPVYAGFADTGTGKLQIAFIPTNLAGEDGNSISTYLWEYPASGVTIDSGTINSEDITLSFDPTVATQYWVHYTVTDDGGLATTRHIKIFVYDDTTEPELTAFDSLDITCQLPIETNQGASEGWMASVVAFADMTTVLNRTLCCVWSVDKYNGSETTIVNNISLVGRFFSESNTTSFLSGDASGQIEPVSSFEIEGPLMQLARLNFYPIEFENGTGTSEYTLKVPALTVWRAVWVAITQFTTFGSLFPVSFDDTTDDFEYSNFVAQGGDTLATLADFCQSLNGVCQARQDGVIQVGRRTNMLADSDRVAAVTVADMTTEDITGSLEIPIPYVSQIGSLEANGGSYAIDTDPSFWLAVAPAGSPQEAPGVGQLPRQVLTTVKDSADQQAELVQRTGDAFAALQNLETINTGLNSGWHFLTPAVDQRYTWTIPASLTIRQVTYDSTKDWWLQSIQKSWTPQIGSWDVTGGFVEETNGEDGTIVILPVVNSGAYGIDIGDFNEIQELLPIDIDAFGGNVVDDDGGFSSVDGSGSHNPGTGWESTCTAGDDYMNIATDIEACPLTRISITYNATAGAGSDGVSGFDIRNGNGAWQNIHTFTTTAGSGVVETVLLDEVQASGIKVLAYAPQGIGDCTGGIVITSIDYDCVCQDDELDEYDFDFRLSPHSFVVDNYPGARYPSFLGGEYQAGSGWKSTLIDINEGSSPPFYRHWVTISRTISPDFTFRDKELTITNGPQSGSINWALRNVSDGSGSGQMLGASRSFSPNEEFTWGLGVPPLSSPQTNIHKILLQVWTFSDVNTFTVNHLIMTGEFA